MQEEDLKDLLRKHTTALNRHTYIIRSRHLPQPNLPPDTSSSRPTKHRSLPHSIPHSSSGQKARPAPKKSPGRQSKKPAPLSLPRSHTLNFPTPQKQHPKTPNHHVTPPSRSLKSRSSRNHNSNLLAPQLQVTNKQPPLLNDYPAFIRAQSSEKYALAVEVGSVRVRSYREALREQEKTTFHMVMEIYRGIYANIGKKDKKANRLILSYCHMLLSSQQKMHLQIVLSLHYPSLTEAKLRPFLTHSRIVTYALTLLAWDDTLSSLPVNTLESYRVIVKYLSECYEELVRPLLMMEIPTTTPKIHQTFRLLKAVGEVERKVQVISSQFRRILSSAQQSIVEIHHALQPIIKDIQPCPIDNIVLKEMQLSWRHLKLPPTPYLPPNRTKRPYTIVLDVDRTLLFFNQNEQVLKKRPGLNEFLTKLTKFFEVVTFSRADSEYTIILMNQIDPKRELISYCLCQQHLTYFQGHLIKDLSRLGRNLNHVIAVDHRTEPYRQQGPNLISVSQWTQDENDTELIALGHMLHKFLTKPHMTLKDFLAKRAMITEENQGLRKAKFEDRYGRGQQVVG